MVPVVVSLLDFDVRNDRLKELNWCQQSVLSCCSKYGWDVYVSVCSEGGNVYVYVCWFAC